MYKRCVLVAAAALAFLCACAPPLTTPMPTPPGAPALVERAEPTAAPAFTPEPTAWINKEGATIVTRFVPPADFERVVVESDSFAHYLRSLPLKEDGAPVLYYDGGEKPHGVYAAVVDMPISQRDRQQCADAIIRLRAEYLFAHRRFRDIAFHFTSGFLCEYEKWQSGYRVKVEGNECSYVKTASRDESYANFRKYLEFVFAYAGTISLEKELTPVENVRDMAIGDVFVQGGSPGHAVIVVDMIQHKETGEKRFLLAQSYMPAQETQILYSAGEDVWYDLDFGTALRTPEWTFEAGDLRRFS